ncbi:hypothetical protein SELMODRAFT_270477 [Selaginella moellendorffii]|uniref:Calcyclin-binding protein n=1 Tax=Selaginella moellendorffii TaxID=88036 RepID=D8R233_SELML|nr:calcyclin-binding protein [Selaginella moellendorffii]EFJ33657.1 hypothetical protein SELMODRAFT_270477 [Selaginella moellendorffii]|eukprot:XP_002964819.1 calcyclin-binding protein [Selaginella moellendorffii]
MAPDVMDDLQELKALLDQAKRPRVKSLLSAEIERMQKGLIENEAKPAAPLEKIPVAAPEPRYTTVDSFSWDQDDKSVKIYIGIEGASADKVSSKFQDESFEIKIEDLGGKNYRCGVPRLQKPIDPAASNVIVKPKRLVVVLKKMATARWTDLHYKEDKFKPDEGKNPMAGIMDLMKNMYDEGDDNMKKTIAQAWTDARAKQGGL